MAVGKRMRFEVFKRDGFACQYCGRTPPNVVLEADHIHPVSDGGPDEMTNLVTARFDCNRGKAANPLSDVPRPLLETMQEQADRESQMAAYNAFLMEARARAESQIESLGAYWFDKMVRRKADRGKYVFGPSPAASVRRFLKSLTAAELMEAMDLAEKIPATLSGDEKRWRYFCAVCWNKIRAAQ